MEFGRLSYHNPFGHYPSSFNRPTKAREFALRSRFEPEARYNRSRYPKTTRTTPLEPDRLLDFAAASDLLADRATLVSANNRLARHLAGRYGESRAAGGATAWETPDILPLGAWLNRCHELLRDDNQITGHLLDSHQNRLVWERQVAQSPIADSLLRPDSAANLAAEAWNRLCAWNLTLEDIRPSASRETRAFVEWAQGFIRDCDKHGWVDSARLPSIIAEGIGPGTLPLPPAMVLAGFEQLPPAIESLMSALEDKGCRVFELRPPRYGNRQRRLGLADSTAELEAAASWAIHQLCDNGDARLGIVIPDLAYRRTAVIRILDSLLHGDTAAEPGTPSQRIYNLSLGAPLREAPVVNDALLMLRLIQSSLDFGELSTLLRSPFLGEGESEYQARSSLDTALREQPDRRTTAHRLLRLAGDRCPSLSRMLISAVNGFEKSTASPSTWSLRFREALATLGWPGERGLDSSEYQQAQRFRDLVDQLPALAMVAPSMDAAQALSILTDMTRQTTFQPETEAGTAIQILGLLEADGQSFDGLWVTGLSDQQFPPAGEPNPLLPVALQRAHGMPQASADQTLAFSRQLLHRLLTAAPEVMVSWPRRDGDRELLPTSLIMDLESDTFAQTGIPLLNTPAARWLGSQSLTAIEDLTGIPVPTGTRIGGGTGLLYDQAACPFRAYARHRLFAKALGDPETEPSPLTRGSLLHLALEAFWRSVGDQGSLLGYDDKSLNQQISAAVEQALERAGSDLSAASRDLERRRLGRRLNSWLDIERQRAPFAVIVTEDRREVSVGGLCVNVQTDRIDRLNDERQVVIDYKSGNAQRDGWFGERLFEPQLPLYAVTVEDAAMAAVAFAQLKPGDLRFVGTAEDKDLLPGVKALSSDARSGDLDDWPDLLAHWNERLNDLAHEIRQGLAPVAPQKKDACTYCDLADLCRIVTLSDDQAHGTTGDDLD